MKTISKVNKGSLVFLTALVCMIVASSISAHAVPTSEVFLTFTPQTLTGKCCFLFGDTIKVAEPASVVPVVVTWTTEYRTANPFYFGLSLNGGGCIAYGPRSLGTYNPPDGTGDSKTFQWVLSPSNGLVQGMNTFTVCGGGVSNNSDTILLGIRTLAVRLSK